MKHHIAQMKREIVNRRHRTTMGPRPLYKARRSKFTGWLDAVMWYSLNVILSTCVLARVHESSDMELCESMEHLRLKIIGF
jgi:hypothetical protein